MVEATNYVVMRRCLNCWYVCDGSLNSCPQCNYVFLKEATEEEKEIAMAKLEEMQQRRSEVME